MTAEMKPKVVRESDIVKIIMYQNVFGSDFGQKVLEDLKKVHFYDFPTFSENPQRQAYQEGQRAVILRIINSLNVNVQQLKDQLNKEGMVKNATKA